MGLSANRAPLLSIVVVTWNSRPYLPRCLEGIEQQTHAARELIVVDNASSDGSAEFLAPHADRLIRNDTNRGFSVAVNQAIAVASGELILLLNPDCHLAADYCARLIAALESAGSDCGAATGMLLRATGETIAPSGEIDSLGIMMTRSGRHLDLGQGQAAAPVPAEPQSVEVFGVSGAAALFRTAFLRDVAVDGEIFDEDFFAYREDADLAWRGRLLGWRAIVVPGAVGWHVRRVTPEARSALPSFVNMHSVKNRFLLRIKNEGRYLALRNAPFTLARDLVVIAAVLTVERSSMPALAWLWRNRRRVLAKRRIIQSRRKVADRELARWFR